MTNPISDQEKEFLIQSNLIEGIGEEGLQESINAWLYTKEQKQITVDNLLKCHWYLLRHLDPFIAGSFRKVNVTVGGRKCPGWWYIDKKIVGVLENINAGPCIGKEDILDDWIKRCHIQFEHLHPFQGGNGRVGRMLMNWQRLKFGLDILIIKFEDRYDYYQWFEEKII